jgi:hypothetical protein
VSISPPTPFAGIFGVDFDTFFASGPLVDECRDRYRRSPLYFGFFIEAVRYKKQLDEDLRTTARSLAFLNESAK